MKYKLKITRNSIYPIFILFIALLLQNCRSYNSMSYNGLSEEQVISMVEKREFQVEFDFAYPMVTSSLAQLSNSGLLGIGNSSGQINLIGNPNFVTVKGDSINADLPFYGERRMGGAYSNRDVGVELNALMEEYKLDYNEKKNRYRMNFRIDGRNENYNAYFTIFKNGVCELQLIGDQRTPIQYRGNISPLETIK